MPRIRSIEPVPQLPKAGLPELSGGVSDKPDTLAHSSTGLQASAVPDSHRDRNQTSVYSIGQSQSEIPFLQSQGPRDNGQRISQAKGIQAFAKAEVTEDGIAYLGFAALKGRDEKTGIEMDILSASVQTGSQNEAQASMAHLAVANTQGTSVGLDLFAVSAGAGVLNSDGSIGANGRALAVVGHLEGSLSTGATGLTLGASIGAGGEYSAGVRDRDHDGYGEFCARASLDLGPGITIGIQIEDPRGWDIWE